MNLWRTKIPTGIYDTHAVPFKFSYLNGETIGNNKLNIRMKSTIFWDFTPWIWYKFREVSEDGTASIFSIEK
jgi:hypothetical protein